VLAGVLLVLTSVVLPVYAWEKRSIIAMVPSWIVNLLTLQYSMIEYAEAVDASSRLQYYWHTVMYLMYALAVANFALTIAIAGMLVVQRREERLRRIVEPP